MKRRVIGIVAAIALASIGTIVLVGYVQSARTDAVASTRNVRVWVVKKAVPKGTAAADIKDSLGQTTIPNNLLASGAVTDLTRLKGLVTNTALVAGEQVLASRFDTPTVARQGDVPKGLLQVSVKLEPQRALGGRIRVGDTVGVLLSFPADKPIPAQTNLQLHKVLVTSVLIAGDATEVPDPTGTSSSGKKADTVSAGPTDSLLVTLAVSAPSVEKIVYAAEFGSVWLSNEPSNAPEGGTVVVNPGNVYSQAASVQ
jgi:pilus assembly protein CpaB